MRLAFGIVVLSALPASADAFLLLERDQDVQGQTDLFLISYAAQDAFLTNGNATQTSLPQAINGGFSAGGLTVDASGGWHLLLERDIDLAGQTDLFLISYADQDAFLTNGNATQTALPQAINGGFSAGGLTVDASGGWHLLLERDTDLAGQTDLFLISYADQDAFLTNGNATQTSLPQAINAGFSSGAPLHRCDTVSGARTLTAGDAGSGHDGRRTISTVGRGSHLYSVDFQRSDPSEMWRRSHVVSAATAT